MATFVTFHMPSNQGDRDFHVLTGDPTNQETLTGLLYLHTGDNANGYGISESTHVMYCEGVTFDNTTKVGGTYE